MIIIRASSIIPKIKTKLPSNMSSNCCGEMSCHMDMPQRQVMPIRMPAIIELVFLRILRSEKIKIWFTVFVSVSCCTFRVLATAPELAFPALAFDQ